MTVGYKIKKLREDKKLSQPELASLLNISQAKLSNIENGKTESIDFALMDNVCKVFDKDFKFFTENTTQINNVKRNDNGAVVNNHGTINLFPEKIIEEIKKLIEQNRELTDQNQGHLNTILALTRENDALKGKNK